jgi:hypothetical protein
MVPVRGAVDAHLVLGAEYTRNDLADSPVAEQVLVLRPIDLGTLTPWRVNAVLMVGF